jgi:hypothetical protein
MKLVFRKDDDNKIAVLQKKGRDLVEFDYVEMIKDLMKTKKLMAPKIEGDFSDSEKESISNMVGHINDEVAAFYEAEEE